MNSNQPQMDEINELMEKIETEIAQLESEREFVDEFEHTARYKELTNKIDALQEQRGQLGARWSELNDEIISEDL